MTNTREFTQIATFWNERPCNIRHSSLPHDSLYYSREVTARKYHVEPHIRRFAEHERWGRKTVLDLGCGIGTCALEFARNGAMVVGVDISARSLLVARKRANAESLTPNVTFVYGNIEDLGSLQLGTKYDLVYSFGVIHHTVNPERAVAQAFEHCREGGEFRCMLYHARSWKVLQILATFGKFQFWKAKEIVPRYSEAQTGSPITHIYSRREARALIESAGFQVYSIEVDHIFPYRVPDYIEHRYVKEWWWRKCSPKFFRWLEQRLGWHILIKARKEAP